MSTHSATPLSTSRTVSGSFCSGPQQHLVSRQQAKASHTSSPSHNKPADSFEQSLSVPSYAEEKQLELWLVSTAPADIIIWWCPTNVCVADDVTNNGFRSCRPVLARARHSSCADKTCEDNASIATQKAPQANGLAAERSAHPFREYSRVVFPTAKGGFVARSGRIVNPVVPMARIQSIPFTACGAGSPLSCENGTLNPAAHLWGISRGLPYRE